MEKVHIIENTLSSNYKIAYFPISKRFFKVNDKAINLIKDIISEKNNEYLIKKYKLNINSIQEYRDKIFTYMKPITYNVSENDKEKILGRLVIHLANGCNLRCVYCYANGGVYHSDPQLMSREMVDCIIQKFYSEFKHIEGLQLFGGEPLLNLDVLEYACEKFREKDPNIDIGIVTNGTLIDEQFISIAKKYSIHTTISYDGDYVVNNLLRVRADGSGASQDILDKAKYFEKETGLLELIEATYTQYHFNNNVSVLDILKHIETELPEIPVHLAPAGGAECCDYILKDYKPFIDSVDDIFEENSMNNKDYTYPLMQRIVYSIVNKIPGSAYICDAGIGTISVSVTGDVYPCFMFTDQEKYRLGNIKDENLFQSEKMKETIKRIRDFSEKDKNEECNNCFIKNVCNGCLGLDTMNTESSDLKMDTKTCEMFRKMTEKILVRLAELSQNSKEGE